jgi:hypothetical protein
MISGTYLTSGILLIISAQLFKAGGLKATTQALYWPVTFFFAPAGASAGYLAVSEVFPLEALRAINAGQVRRLRAPAHVTRNDGDTGQAGHPALGFTSGAIRRRTGSPCR